MQVENVNNRSIPSTNTERKITDLSDLNSFTLPPSLSPYRQTELQRNGITEKRIHLLCVGWRNLFPVVLLCQFFVLAGNRFWFYILLM
jgi:hypothetical protein